MQMRRGFVLGQLRKSRNRLCRHIYTSADDRFLCGRPRQRSGGAGMLLSRFAGWEFRKCLVAPLREFSSISLLVLRNGSQSSPAAATR